MLIYFKTEARWLSKRGAAMKFARIVFWIAAVWGLLVITPLFFMLNLISKNDPPPITHPGFYYGFVAVAFTWQLAFVVMARQPVRLRPMMIPAMLEKFGWITVVLVLYSQGRMKTPDLMLGIIDGVLGILFVVAYAKTKTGALATTA
jgi:hypothetical protein